MTTTTTELDGFDAMGHPIPEDRRQAAYEAVKAMAPGVSTEDAMGLVGRVADLLERDKPYQALQEAGGGPAPRGASTAEELHSPEPGLFRLDTTGAYRLLAHLLTPTTERSTTDG